MSKLYRIFDELTNLNHTLNNFSKKYSNEIILYRSGGIVFKRNGDTRLKKRTSFLNRRGNFIISNRRCYFSNPIISFHNLYIIIFILSFLLFIPTSILFFINTFGLLVSKTTTIVFGLLFSLFIIYVILKLILNVFQSIPTIIDIEHAKMRMRYLSKYKTIYGTYPMFSSFDGKHTYHFVGSKQINKETKNRIERIFGSKRDFIVQR